MKQVKIKRAIVQSCNEEGSFIDDKGDVVYFNY